MESKRLGKAINSHSHRVLGEKPNRLKPEF